MNKIIITLFFCVISLYSFSQGKVGKIEYNVPKGNKIKLDFVLLGAFYVNVNYCDSILKNGKEHVVGTCPTKASGIRKDTALLSLESFYLHRNYISNKEYRAFVKYVIDSTVRESLNIKIGSGERAYIDFKKKINPLDSNYISIIKDLNYDSLLYEFPYIDFNASATEIALYRKKIDSIRGINFEKGEANYERRIGYVDGVVRISKEFIYPDTSIWFSIESLSFQKQFALSRFYFSSKEFENNPVVGLNEKQISAYAVWLSRTVNAKNENEGKPYVNDFRIPTIQEILYYDYRPPIEFSLLPYKDTIILQAQEYSRYQEWCKNNQFKDIGFVFSESIMRRLPFNFKESYSLIDSLSISQQIEKFKHLKNQNILHLLSYEQYLAFYWWKQTKVKGESIIVLPTLQEFNEKHYNQNEVKVEYPGKVFRLVQTYLGRKKGNIGDSQVY